MTAHHPHERLAVVGQGYVGLPLAMRAVDVGFDVVGFEVAQAKVEGLRSGRSHIDDIDDDTLGTALASGRYLPTSDPADLAGFDIAVITVPTPLSGGVPDLSYVESGVGVLLPHVRPGCTIILESTTYPGTTDELIAASIEEETGLKAGIDVHVGYSPERIDPGNTTWGFKETPKVVAGLTPESLEQVQRFYDQLVDQTVPVSSTGAAELTKLLENTFRHVNIALINELAMHAHALGIDIWEVIDAASTKPFGFMPFRPGPGVGGHCLPIDPSYLSWRVEQVLGTRSRFVDIANDINDEMPRYVAQRLQAGLNHRKKPVNGSRVLVVGLAYKPNTNDARETPTTGVIQALLELGADVRVHDEWVQSHPIDAFARRVGLTADEISASDAVIIVTNHHDLDLDLITQHAEYVLDTRRATSGERVEHL